MLDTELPKDNVQGVNILPSECGKRSSDILNTLDDQKARVVGGYEVVRGSYPWQVIKQKTTLCRRLLV